MFIDASLLYCEKIILKENPILYFYFKDLPIEKKYSTFAIFNFYLKVKIIIDNDKISELDKLESELIKFRFDNNIDGYLWSALREVFMEYNMNIQPFKNIINVNRMFLRYNTIISMEELLKYSYYSGSSVGLILFPILKKDKLSDENKKRLAQTLSELWNGVTLVKILTDLNYDLKKGRVYFPKSLFERFSYSKWELENGVVNENFINIWEFIANFASNSFDFAKKNLDVFSGDVIYSIKSIINLNEMLLNEVRINRYNFSSSNFTGIKRFKHLSEKMLPTNF